MRELTATPATAFPANGQMRADLPEIAALKKEVARLRAREIQDAKLVTAIETSCKASDRTYGARRVWRDVLDLERKSNRPGDRLLRTRGWPAGFTGSNG